MRSLFRSVTIALLGMLAGLSVPVRAQNACGDAFKTPPVGGWVQWQASQGMVKFALVGTEQQEGKTHYRFEMSGSGERGSAVMQMLVADWPFSMSAVEEMIMQTPGQPPMRMSGAMVKMMSQNAKVSVSDAAERCRQMAYLGEESVTVPAGTFQTKHYKDPKEGGEAWVSPTVPFGLVKAIDKDGNAVVLVAKGTDAKTAITGKPVDMPVMPLGPPPKE